jgi:hypothetical protein
MVEETLLTRPISIANDISYLVFSMVTPLAVSLSLLYTELPVLCLLVLSMGSSSLHITSAESSGRGAEGSSKVRLSIYRRNSTTCLLTNS